jgi:hypothetical protein
MSRSRTKSPSVLATEAFVNLIKTSVAAVFFGYVATVATGIWHTLSMVALWANGIAAVAWVLLLIADVGLIVFLSHRRKALPTLAR